MSDDFFDIAELISKYLTGDLTGEEKVCLEDWLNLKEENQEWFRLVTSEEFVKYKRNELKSIDVEAGWKALSRKRTQEHRRYLWIDFLKYACVFILCVSPIIFFLMQDSNHSVDINAMNVEICPGVPKAILHMADGTVVDLATRSRDTLKEQDGTLIGLHGESIIYKNTDTTTKTDLFNELVVPRGGEFVLTLSDGSIVCLNAGSKLKFPVNFSGSTRCVELEGEGYFQVARNEKMPFVVRASGVDITVLGTEFNVSNYPENTDVQTTLVKGSVKVTNLKNENSCVLQPGEQAVYNKRSGEMKVAEVDVSYAVAWKEGRLRFRDRPLKEIMDFISRWYDVEVVYEDEEVKDYLFGCNFARHETIEPLLGFFERTGTVHFKISNRKIIVSK